MDTLLAITATLTFIILMAGAFYFFATACAFSIVIDVVSTAYKATKDYQAKTKD